MKKTNRRCDCLAEINDLRESIGLDIIKITKTKCLRCGSKEQTTVSNRICPECRRANQFSVTGSYCGVTEQYKNHR